MTTTTKTNTFKNSFVFASAVVCAAIALAITPNTAYAENHPLKDVNPANTIPVAVAAKATKATDSPLDAGMMVVLDQASSIATTEGSTLMEAQATKVRENVAQSAADAAAKAEAEAQVSAAATSTQTQTSAQQTKTNASAPSPQATQVSDARANTAASAPAPAPAAPAPATINVDGDVMGYVDTYLASTAPKSGAGLWLGSDSTTDGTWGYFIGHNPGPFHHVMDLTKGSAVTVTDRSGNTRTYHVIDTFTIPNTTYFEDIESRISGHGESIVLQTCCGDGANYRVVVAV